MKTSKIDRWVYSHTKKPSHYREVRKPPRTPKEKRERPQDARQMQYNRWSKHFKVYSGSYLPKDERKLLKQGWVEEKPSKKPIKKSTFYRRKSTNQWVRNDHDNKPWHWYNWWKKILGTKHFRDTNFEDAYLDKYGDVCGGGDEQHHLGNEGE